MANADQDGVIYKKLILGLLGTTIIVFGFIYVIGGDAFYDDIPSSVPEAEDRTVLSAQDSTLQPEITYLQTVEVEPESPAEETEETAAPDMPGRSEAQPQSSSSLDDKVKRFLGNLF